MQRHQAIIPSFVDGNEEPLNGSEDIIGKHKSISSVEAPSPHQTLFRILSTYL